MSTNSTSPQAPCDPSTEWMAVLRELILTGKKPEIQPGGGVTNPGWQALVDDLLQMREFIRALAMGDLSEELEIKGQLAVSLQMLQANLRHLTWQVQQVASGDLSQRVDFMGEFSDAFNTMVDRLRWAREELEASQERYQSIISASPDDITITDLNGVIQFVSPSGIRMFGAQDVEDMVGRHILEFIHPNSLDTAKDIFQFLQKGTYSGISEFQAIQKDGSMFFIDANAEIIHGFDGRPTGILFVIRNVDVQKKAQIAEREQRAQAEALRDTASALNSVMSLDEVFDVILVDLGRVVPYDAVDIMLTSPDGTARLARAAGYEKMIPSAQHPSSVFIIDQTPNLKKMTDTMKPLVVADIREYEWRETSVTEWVRSHLGVPILIKDEVAGFINLMSSKPGFYTEEHAQRLMVFTNLAAIAIDRAHLFEQQQYLAQTDPLTGIANRRQLVSRGEEEINRSRRYKSPLSVLMLDIDNFKIVNDSYGHHLGDQVLIVIAVTCSNLLRNIDLIGRYGGEEFAVLLPETNASQAEVAAERLRAEIANQVVTTHAGYIQVTVSIGVAELTPEDKSFMAFLDRADQALYQAKQGGRNRVKVITPPPA